MKLRCSTHLCGPAGRLLVGILAAVVTAAAVGCDSDSSKDDDQGRPVGGSVTIGAAQGIPQLDPHKAQTTWEWSLYPLLWSTLVRYEKDTGLKLQPGLATKWESSEDARTYTFHLRKGVRFSDGAALEAADVVGSLKRVLDPDIKFNLRSTIPAIKQVKAIDDSTIRIELAKPSVHQLLASMAVVPILDMSALKTIDREPATLGPFKVKDFVPDDHVTLTRNKEYWGPAAPADEIKIVRAQDAAAAVTSLRSKDLDILWNVPWADIKALEDGGVTIVQAANPASQAIYFPDNSSPPFNNRKARQALVYATDKQKIINIAYAGKVEISKANVPMPAGDGLYDSELSEYPFDLSRAKELFAEAGVGPGSTITFWTTGGAFPEWTTFAQILQSDLEKIGIKLKIESRELNTWAQRIAPSGKRYPGLVVPNLYSSFPSPFFLAFWVPPVCECNYDNPRYSRAVREADTTRDPERRKTLYAEAQRIFAQDAPTVVIGQTSWPTAVRPEVTGAWSDPGTLPHFEDVQRVER